jgi:peptidoglycan/LPS O-acetylase OafA/YrhL
MFCTPEVTGANPVQSRAELLDEFSAPPPMAPSASPKLDFLRSCAVLIVVASHLWFEVEALGRFGRLGVLLFFFHTSLVLMFSLERQVQTGGRRRLWTTFMLRRVCRIFPLSIVVVLGVYVLRIPGYVFVDGHVQNLHPDPVGLALNLLLVQEVVISNGGFGSTMGVLWTLPVELQTYLFLPVIFLLLHVVKSLHVLLGLWMASALGGYGVPHVIDRAFSGGAIAEFDWGWIVFPRLIEFAPYFLGGVLAYAMWTTLAVAGAICGAGGLPGRGGPWIHDAAGGFRAGPDPDRVQHTGGRTRAGASVAARAGARMASAARRVRGDRAVLIQHLPDTRTVHLARIRRAA